MTEYKITCPVCGTETWVATRTLCVNDDCRAMLAVSIDAPNKDGFALGHVGCTGIYRFTSRNKERDHEDD